jgi:hypothetical protein
MDDDETTMDGQGEEDEYGGGEGVHPSGIRPELQ